MDFIIGYIKKFWQYLVSIIKRKASIYVHAFSKESIDKIQKNITEYQHTCRFDIQDVEVTNIKFIDEDRTTNNENF